MVALGENLSPPPTLSAALTPILATSQLTTEKAFSIHRWRPRAGLDEHHPLWKAGVRRLFAAYDLTEEELFTAVAQCRAILSGTTTVAWSHDLAEALRQAALLDASISRWQAVNTSIFWHVLASVDLASSHSPTDMRYIETLYSKRLADGVGLLRYLHRFADTDDGRVQRQLKQSVGRPLAPPLTRARLHHHCEQLFQRWQLISGNDPARLASLVDYWAELQATLPTAPVASASELMLSSWLAGQTAVPRGTVLDTLHYSPAFRSYDSGVSELIEHARALGVPPGDAIARSALVYLGPDGQLVLGDDCLDCDADGGESSALNAIGGGAPPGGKGERGNKCTFCPAWSCKSDQQGGPANCICRWDSTNDLTLLTPGARRYVLMARRYHEAHKDTVTLKGVEFVVKRPDGEG